MGLPPEIETYIRMLRREIAAIVQRLVTSKKIVGDYRNGVGHAEHREGEQGQRDNESVAEQIRLAHATERKRSAEHKQNLCVQWVIGTGTWAAVVAACIYAGIANSQLTQMRRATNAAEMGVRETEMALHVSERAYLAASTPQFDLANHIVILPIINSGHIPSGELHITVHEGAYAATTPYRFDWDHAIERHWTYTSVQSSQPGNPLSINVRIPSFSAKEYGIGNQLEVIVGNIGYDDGFADDGWQYWIFCMETVNPPHAGRIDWMPCDGSGFTQVMQAKDGWPYYASPN